MKKLRRLIAELRWCPEYENEPRTSARTVHRLGDLT